MWGLYFYITVIFFALLPAYKGKNIFVSKRGHLPRQKLSPEYQRWFEMQSQQSPYLFEDADVNSLKLVQVASNCKSNDHKA